MTRRNFLGGLAACLAACTAPQVLFDRKLWKAPLGNRVLVLNPEWVDAPYEIGAAFPPNMGKTIRPVVFRKDKPVPEDIRRLPWPIRFDEAHDIVFPFVEKRI